MTMKRNISTGFLMLLLIIFSPMASLQWMGSTPVEAYRSVKETEYDVRIYQADPPLKKLMGDIDGDGLIDIPMKYRGDGIYIKFGKSIEYGRTYNATEDYDFAIIGNVSPYLHVYLKLITDINSDGYSDLIVRTYSEIAQIPRIHILYGRDQFPHEIMLDADGNSSIWDVNIEGYPDQSVLFGSFVLVFDYDRDGRKDLFLSDPNMVYSPTEKGVIYGISGEIIERKKNITYRDFEFSIIGRKYSNSSDNLGFGLYSIDFDGDGNEDWVWSDGFVDLWDKKNVGIVMVIYNEGKELTGNLTVDDFNTTTIFGADAEDYLGMEYDQGLAKGDFNGDGIDDLVITIGGSDGEGNRKHNCGEVVVLLGNRTRQSRIDIERSERVYFRIYGSTSWEGVGVGGGVDVADYNNDSYPDIIFSSGVTITSAFSGAAYIWLGRENPEKVYSTQESSEVGFEGVSDDDLEWYGHYVFFADVNNDGFPDVVTAPDAHHYFDIFLNKNDPPVVEFSGVQRDTVFRGEDNHLWILCYDDRTPFHDLNITIQFSVDGGEWRELMDYFYEEDERNLTVNITLPISGVLGVYSYRLMVVDSEGLSSGWIYYNDSVEVVNSPPEIDRVEVVGGRDYNYYENVSVLVYADDVEDGIGGLNGTLYLISLFGGERYNVSWVEVVVSEDHLNMTFEVLPEIENGSYDIAVRVEDMDGGFDDEVWGGRIDILDSPSVVEEFNISRNEVERGEIVLVSFVCRDINDEVPESASIRLWDLFSGYSRKYTVSGVGGEHEKRYMVEVEVGREWMLGLYNATVILDGKEYTFREVLRVRNSPPKVKKSVVHVNVDRAGVERISLGGMVEDYEDGFNLTYRLLGILNEIEMRVEGDTLVIEVGENVSGRWNVSIVVSDGDGDYVNIYVDLEVNTSVEVKIPEVEVEFAVLGEGRTYNSTTVLQVKLLIINVGEVGVDVSVEPLGVNWSFLEFTLELGVGENYTVERGVRVELVDGLNVVDAGVLVRWGDEVEIKWSNVTVERLKVIDNSTVGDGEKNNKGGWWFYPLIAVVAATILITLILYWRRSGNGRGLTE